MLKKCLRYLNRGCQKTQSCNNREESFAEDARSSASVFFVVHLVAVGAVPDLLDLVTLHRRRENGLVRVLSAGAGRRRSLRRRRHHRVVVEPVCRAVLDLKLVFESLFEALGVINQL